MHGKAPVSEQPSAAQPAIARVSWRTDIRDGAGRQGNSKIKGPSLCHTLNTKSTWTQTLDRLAKIYATS